MSNIITLLTDFGTTDSYVAQMKGVLLTHLRHHARAAAAGGIVDISHNIPPQNIREGARVLREVALWYPPGTVHVVVVDPGVGTHRRIVAVEIEQRRFVLPDNGLLTGLLIDFPVERAYCVENTELCLPQISRSFHGRDMMAPVAAFLAIGGELAEVGPAAGALQQITWPQPRREGDAIVAEVLAVDHFGNVLTNVRQQVDPRLSVGATLSVDIAGRRRELHLLESYGHAPPGQLVAIFGSQGYLELAEVNGSAASRLVVSVGAPLEIRVH